MSATDKGPGLLSQFLENFAKPLSNDIMLGLPDSLFVGSAFFSLFTQSQAYGFLTLAMVEFIAVYNILAKFSNFVSTGASDPIKCLPGYSSLFQLSILSCFTKQSSFPSGPVFFVGAVYAYILASIISFSDEYNYLGEKNADWKSRIPMSVIFGTIFLFGFIAWRFMNSCDNIVPMIGSLILGIVIGTIVQRVHYSGFGEDSVNFLGVPLLLDRAADGKPMYICSK